MSEPSDPACPNVGNDLPVLASVSLPPSSLTSQELESYRSMHLLEDGGILSTYSIDTVDSLYNLSATYIDTFDDIDKVVNAGVMAAAIAKKSFEDLLLTKTKEEILDWDPSAEAIPDMEALGNGERIKLLDAYNELREMRTRRSEGAIERLQGASVLFASTTMITSQVFYKFYLRCRKICHALQYLNPHAAREGYADFVMTTFRQAGAVKWKNDTEATVKHLMTQDWPKRKREYAKRRAHAKRTKKASLPPLSAPAPASTPAKASIPIHPVQLKGLLLAPAPAPAIASASALVPTLKAPAPVSTSKAPAKTPTPKPLVQLNEHSPAPASAPAPAIASASALVSTLKAPAPVSTSKAPAKAPTPTPPVQLNELPPAPAPVNALASALVSTLKAPAPVLAAAPASAPEATVQSPLQNIELKPSTLQVDNPVSVQLLVPTPTLTQAAAPGPGPEATVQSPLQNIKPKPSSVPVPVPVPVDKPVPVPVPVDKPVPVPVPAPTELADPTPAPEATVDSPLQQKLLSKPCLDPPVENAEAATATTAAAAKVAKVATAAAVSAAGPNYHTTAPGGFIAVTTTPCSPSINPATATAATGTPITGALTAIAITPGSPSASPKIATPILGAFTTITVTPGSTTSKHDEISARLPSQSFEELRCENYQRSVIPPQTLPPDFSSQEESADLLARQSRREAPGNGNTDNSHHGPGLLRNKDKAKQRSSDEDTASGAKENLAPTTIQQNMQEAVDDDGDCTNVHASWNYHLEGYDSEATETEDELSESEAQFGRYSGHRNDRMQNLIQVATEQGTAKTSEVGNATGVINNPSSKPCTEELNRGNTESATTALPTGETKDSTASPKQNAVVETTTESNDDKINPVDAATMDTTSTEAAAETKDSTARPKQNAVVETTTESNDDKTNPADAAPPMNSTSTKAKETTAKVGSRSSVRIGNGKRKKVQEAMTGTTTAPKAKKAKTAKTAKKAKTTKKAKIKSTVTATKKAAPSRKAMKIVSIAREVKKVKWSMSRKAVRPPIVCTLANQPNEADVQVDPEFKEPGKNWIKEQNSQLVLLQNLLGHLSREDGISIESERRALYVEDAMGGSIDGGDVNARAFVCLVAAILYSLKSSSESGSIVGSILVSLKKAEPNPGSLSLASIAKAGESTSAMEEAITKSSLSIADGTWLQPLAATLMADFDGTLPSTREGWNILCGLHSVVSRAVVNQCLQDVGFIPGLVIDTTCRTAVLALGMVDTNAYLDGAKPSAEYVEGSLKTWLHKLDWKTLPITIAGLVEILHFPTVENQTKLVEKRIRKAFPADQALKLMRMLSYVKQAFTTD